MSSIDSDGMLVDPRVIRKRFASIEPGDLDAVRALVVHQKRCYHVGRLIKSKCLEINKVTCADKALAQAMTLGWAGQINAIDGIERQKSYPARYPVNSDSLSIELVGVHIDDKRYEAVTPQQNTTLRWLVGELFAHFGLSKADVVRHPDISYKNPGEAAGAQW